ncbi:MAG TPA: hypothetical protein PK771_06150 [Spirochaetota bacterium]|mgnify:CR=1 FL=1|nr:hypothetical protein [Spirochaetota bacterium]
MKNIIFILILLFIYQNFIYSQKKGSSIQFNGSIESVVDLTHPKFINNGYFRWGFQNQANLRLKSNIGEYMTINLAVNINTITGNYTDLYKYLYVAEAFSSFPDIMNISEAKLMQNTFYSIPFYYKNTFVGSFELERLSFKGGNDYFDIEAGLIRLARGFGNVFSPNDFFNPRDAFRLARPEGKMAVVATFYPEDFWKIQNFIVAPDNPLESRGWGFKGGVSTDFSIKKFNFQFQYALLMPEMDWGKDPKDYGLPETTQNDFSHIAGFSMKADIEIGLFLDMIYRFDHRVLYTQKYYGRDFHGYEGLEASIGFDYTIPFANSNIYLLCEYMFYGSGMLHFSGDEHISNMYRKNGERMSYKDWVETPVIDRTSYFDQSKKSLNFLRHNYLFGMIRMKVNDYLNIGNSYMFGADDQSGILSLFFDIEPFQSFSINITAMYPFDWKLANNEWIAGEFGATNLGFYQNYKITMKVKF